MTSVNLAVKIESRLYKHTGDVLPIRGAPLTTADISHAKVRMNLHSACMLKRLVPYCVSR